MSHSKIFIDPPPIIENEIQKFNMCKKKSPDSDHFTEKGCKTLTSVLHSVIQKTEEGRVPVNSFY